VAGARNRTLLIRPLRNAPATARGPRRSRGCEIRVNGLIHVVRRRWRWRRDGDPRVGARGVPVVRLVGGGRAL